MIQVLEETRRGLGPDPGLLKVIGGGLWHSFGTDIRGTARGKGGFALKTHGIGFRCARSLGSLARMAAESS